MTKIYNYAYDSSNGNPIKEDEFSFYRDASNNTIIFVDNNYVPITGIGYIAYFDQYKWYINGIDVPDKYCSGNNPEDFQRYLKKLVFG